MPGEVNLDDIALVDIKSDLYRLIPSCFPPIDLFEGADSADFELLAEIEGFTNDRLRTEAGKLRLVSESERIYGPGSTPVMAAFTHVGSHNRFNGPDIGAYYAGLSIDTAIAETRFHRARFLAASNEEPVKIDMRCYVNHLVTPVHNLFGENYQTLFSKTTDYAESQTFAMQARMDGSPGFYYPSVRHEGGECIVAFRPNALTPVTQGKHYAYVWDGTDISEIYELNRVG
jgi:hypothetical protein